MRVKIVQHVWHSKEPVFSLDFHPAGYLVTGGSDKTINIWDVGTEADGSPVVTHVTDLQGHTRAVNCVRFSHSGHCLASSGDHGEIIIWRPAVLGAPTTVAGSTAAVIPEAAPQTPATAAKSGAITPAAAAPAAARTAAAAAAGSTESPRSSTAPLTPRCGDSSGDAAGGSAEKRLGSPPSAVSVSPGCWKQSSSLRGHHDDVMDLAWSHDDAVVMSGSVDNEVLMFDVESRRGVARLTSHRHFVQGVAWDPLGSFMVSYSQDRTVRIHSLKPPPTGGRASTAVKSSAQLGKDIIQTATLSKRTLPAQITAALTAAAENASAAGLLDQQQQQQQKPVQAYMFQDESLDVFFRRLAWSPDGSLLAIPAGLIKDDDGSNTRNTTYIYARGQWSSPLASLPCPAKASVAVKFCPLLFKLHHNCSSGSNASSQHPAAEAAAAVSTGAGAAARNVLGLPYRLVLAVATLDSVLLYDMQTLEPFLLAGPLHYSQITDLAWSRDGSCLAVSSRDGFCSIITFKQGELGDTVTEHELPARLAAALQTVALQVAATAAKSAASIKTSAAVTPVNARPTSATAASGAAGVAALIGGTTPASVHKKQQQQQPKSAAKRIQPQQVTVGSSPAAAAPAAGQPRRICPSPVLQSSAAVVEQKKAAVVAPVRRRVTPTPVMASSSAAIVDLTRDDTEEPAKLMAAGVSSTGISSQHTPVAQNPAAAPAPRRVIPQPVVVSSITAQPAAVNKALQQQVATPSSDPLPSAAAAVAQCSSGKGRVGVIAIQAAMAAARKKAAAKRAAEGAVEAVEVKKVKATPGKI